MGRARPITPGLFAVGDYSLEQHATGYTVRDVDDKVIGEAPKWMAALTLIARDKGRVLNEQA
jgi:hypothetical protein